MFNGDISEINIIYDTNKSIGKEEDEINIFGSNFVKNNKDKCKLIIDNIEYEITEKFKIKNYKNKTLNIKLKGNDKITDMSNMFEGCSSLISLPDISKWNTNNITDISNMFFGCSSLTSLPDISKWNTKNISEMIYIFGCCSSLSSLLIFQNGILIILLILVLCFIDVHHYYLYLIFLNGILLRLKI